MTPELPALGYDKLTRIRYLNDRLRTTGTGGKMFITAGIQALPHHELFAVLQKVRDFDAFNDDNDPFGEHDFGAFVHNGRKVFWKFDYYGPCMAFGSEDPSDDEKTVRVLTIMLAEEY